MQKYATSAINPAFLVICDVDSTLIDQEVIDLIAAFAGVGDEVANETAAAMAGKLDFAESLVRRVAHLSGASSQVLDEVYQQITLTNGVQELVAAVHQAGGIIGAVSGGFLEILDRLANSLNLDFWHANRFEITAEKLSGKVSGPILDAKAKANYLKEYAAKYNIPISKTIAIGDGANDIPMIQTAGLGVAFQPKAALADVANIVLPERNLAQLIQLLPKKIVV